MSLPDRRYQTMRPQELRNLSAKAQLVRESMPEHQKVYQTKHDGCAVMILVGINVVRIFSREGNEVLSMGHIAEHFRINSVPNMVYFGEAWHPNMEFKDISGMMRRKSLQPGLEAWLFDSITLQEFRAGRSDRPYAMRMKALSHVLDRQMGVMPVLSGATIAEIAVKVQTFREIHGLVFALDGYIQRDIEGPWIAGIDNEGYVLKLKNHISVDLECVGVIEGEGKFKGMVGALEVMWRGERVQVSGGKLTNEQRATYWACAHAVCKPHPNGIVSKIVEVHALSITPDGQLREPRFQRVRWDKTEASE